MTGNASAAGRELSAPAMAATGAVSTLLMSAPS